MIMSFLLPLGPFILYFNLYSFLLLFSGHKKRKIDNRETTLCKFDHMTHIGEAGCTIDKLKRDLIPVITCCIKARFVSFDNPIYKSMQWIDPANWTDDNSTDLIAIKVNLM